MRVLGLDYGSRTVGVAVSDALMMTAQVVETIVRKEENKLRKTCARIEALIGEYQAELIVLGLPLNEDGSMSTRAEKTLEFKEMLERRTGLPVVLQNEFLTTVSADEILEMNGVAKGDRKTYIDRVAAGLILQDYLNNRESGKTGVSL